MSDHDLQRVEELFQAAADLPASERPTFLAGECDGDAALRSRVERLLVRLDRDASLTAPHAGANHPAGPFSAAVISEGPGAFIGRYKLLQVIGEGGFGVVYMAEQQEPVVRKVALKIIKLGMDTREVVARFEAERQALAMMDHPHIARVLDGGATASGRPYFVMELVRGVAITDYCDGNELTTRERLALFEPVCQAVQHAHQKGVIHRDIKPSNVLVTLHDGRPVPKVIDFGVAKAMHTRLTEKTLFTKYEQFIGTPAYMSPEQAQMSALDVDTRTDIYSLGVLLYELLTGSTPFDSQSLLEAGLAEIQRIIREDQPPRPSARISTSGGADVARRRQVEIPVLCRSLRGDLDWIVMKALEKERGRRYGTASELAEDVRRHLRREPVTAGPPGAAYRVRKFLARNRAAVVSATIVGLVLVGGSIGTTFGMIQAGRNADVAQREAENANVALDFLVSTLSLTDRQIGLDPDVTVRTLLDDTANRVEAAFAGQPWVEARIRSTIGRAYLSLGEGGLAEAHLRRSIALVDDLLARERAAERPFGASGFDAGEFYATLWALTNVCFGLERGDAFAIGMRARQVGLDHIGTSHPELAATLYRFVRAVEAGAWAPDPVAMDGVPALHEAAAAAVDMTLEPGDPLWPIVADTFLTAGYLIWYTPHEPLAETFWSKALEIQQRELAPDHPHIAASVRLLTGVLNKAGRGAEAEQLVRASVDAVKRVHEPGSIHVALAEAMLGDNLVSQGRFDEAEPLLRSSHDVIVAAVKRQSNWMAVESFIRLVNLYEGWGREADAVPFRASIARTCGFGDLVQQWPIARLGFGPEHRPLVAALDRVDALCGGISYLASPASREVESLLPALRELDVQRGAVIADDAVRSALVARLMIGWANALAPDAHRAERTHLAEQALAVLEPRADEIPITVAEAIAIVAESAWAAGDEAAALLEARRAWRLARDVVEPAMWFTAAAKVRVARTLLDLGLHEEAETLLIPACARLGTQIGATHGDTHVARRLLFDLYTARGRPGDAAAYADKPGPG